MESAVYLVTEEVAKRSGLIKSRYRIEDGRFVLNNRDLARVRFTPEEYISGLQGVTFVEDQVARTLIARNGFKMGIDTEKNNANVEPSSEWQQPVDAMVENEPSNDGSEETEEADKN